MHLESSLISACLLGAGGGLPLKHFTFHLPQNLTVECVEFLALVLRESS